jgi:uncharacterized protein
MMMKRTLIIGASPKSERYSYIAAQMLTEYGHEVYAHGLREGFMGEIPIFTEWPMGQNFDTITLYVGPQNQPEYEERIVALRPKRVIFNPGTENTVFATKLKSTGIEAVEACTLVMLRTNQF